MNSLRIDQFKPLPSGTEQYTIEFMRHWSVIKLSETPDSVIVGCADVTNMELRERLGRFHSGKIVQLIELDFSEISAFLGKTLSKSLEKEGIPKEEDEKLKLDRLANDAPVVNLVNSLLIDAVRIGASDIHIESFTNETRVRYRVDGILKLQAKFESSRFPAIASRIKIMANLNIMERRLPQDGRITVTIGTAPVDMRVSIVPIARGESIVLRIFAVRDGHLGLGDLGFEPKRVEIMRSFYRIPHGLVLVTGPTGSGKTTTLNAMLEEIKSDELKIITIEDPVEYLVEGIAQIQTNEPIHLGFDTILRRVLRQDPNVIMLGEIRDTQTAELAVRAALTGHLVLTTLHTNDSVSSIIRLKNMGIEAYLIASTLRGVIAQRLVRRLCPECACFHKPSIVERAVFDKYKVEIETLSEARGCSNCGGTGYKGRIAIGELFKTDEEIEELILAESKQGNFAQHLIENKGMVSLAVDGLTKVAHGATTLSEVEREVGL